MNEFLSFFLAIPVLIISALIIFAILCFIIWVINSFDKSLLAYDKPWLHKKFWIEILKKLIIVSLPLGAGVFWELNYLDEMGIFSTLGLFVWVNGGIILLCLLIELIITKTKNLIKK
tara:strand:- start:87 stop:437 length:351 start_codon:yes stop_codon:yes gene_type:complete